MTSPAMTENFRPRIMTRAMVPATFPRKGKFASPVPRHHAADNLLFCFLYRRLKECCLDFGQIGLSNYQAGLAFYLPSNSTT
jgi:hypothetical protein